MYENDSKNFFVVVKPEYKIETILELYIACIKNPEAIQWWISCKNDAVVMWFYSNIIYMQKRLIDQGDKILSKEKN